MLRNDLIGKRLPLTKIGSNTEQYIDELNDYTNIKNKKIVCIDPGLSDILYCVDNDNKEANEFSSIIFNLYFYCYKNINCK